MKKAEITALDNAWSIVVFNGHTNSFNKTLPNKNKDAFKKECMYVHLEDALASSQGNNVAWFMTGDWNMTWHDIKASLQEYEGAVASSVVLMGDKKDSKHAVTNLPGRLTAGYDVRGMDNGHLVLGCELALASSQSKPGQLRTMQDRTEAHGGITACSKLRCVASKH